MLSKILFILMGHMVGDYLFQSDYLALNKGKDNYVLLAHSLLYTVGVVLVANIMGITITPLEMLLLSAIHFPVDYIKARGITTKKLGNSKALLLDQIIHYLTLLAVVVF